MRSVPGHFVSQIRSLGPGLGLLFMLKPVSGLGFKHGLCLLEEALHVARRHFQLVELFQDCEIQDLCSHVEMVALLRCIPVGANTYGAPSHSKYAACTGQQSHDASQRVV